MRIFISSALTHVPRELFAEYSRFLHALCRKLEGSTHRFEVQYALRNSDPQLAQHDPVERARLCYEWDSAMAAQADLLIAECSFPSIGLGIELQVAKEHEIPTILCYRDFGVNRARPITYQNPDNSTHELQIGDGSITLMALGMPMIRHVLQYKNSSDGVQSISKLAADILRRCA
jgi:hypothetical protein